MAKIKTQQGFRFVKELGGAIQHDEVSFAARWLYENHHIRGRVLDFGCGRGFDADHFGWVGYDPYYRQELAEGEFDTIVCNYVLNMLTRESRRSVLESIQSLLIVDGIAWLVVSRNIPQAGKLGGRKRIQNYVVLDLPSVYLDEKMEIYRLSSQDRIDDKTREIETQF